MIWDFFQNQVLGMKWLDALIAQLLVSVGVDVQSPAGGSLEFFIYDVIKITVLLCFLIFVISYIQSYFPPERSRKIMGRFRGVGANVIGALLGTVTPFCSCSSIPIFMGFTSAGLPLGVTGAKVAVAYVIVGLIIAVVGGTLIEKLGMEKYVADFVRQAAKGVDLDAPVLTAMDRAVFAKDQVVQTFRKVFLYILVGVGIGAVIHNWIPASWIEGAFGKGNPFGVILVTLIGVPMYGDIFGTIPIAEALLYKGADLGTVLSFMMAVTTLSLPSMIMLSKVVKAPLLKTFIAICTIGIILVGYLFNLCQGLLLG